MNTSAAPGKDVPLSMQLRLARVHQQIGWAGWAGLFFVAVGLLVGAQGGSVAMAPVAEPVAQAMPMVQGDATSARAEGAPQAPSLPARADMPFLLTKLQSAATEGGMAWPAAEYRFTQATDAEPASLEVRCNVKAPYPQLRAMLSALVREVPGLTLRELSFNRTATEAADVDAKLVLAILFRDEPAAAAPVPTGKATR